MSDEKIGMDSHTLEILEFSKVRDLVAGHAGSSLGKELALALTPLSKLEDIREALEQTTEMVESLQARMEPPLGGLRDVRLSVKRAGLGVLLDIQQILDIRDVLDLSGRVHDYWLRLGGDYPRLDAFLAGVVDFRHLARKIETVIDERGQIRSNATPELARIRAELAHYDERIQAEIRRLLRSPEIRKALRFPQPTLCGEHHVLPVAVNYRHVVTGVVHRTSSTGETVYIEPSKVAELSAEISLLKSAEGREERKVLRSLSSMLGAEHVKILSNVQFLAQLDLLRAKASYSIAHDMVAADVGVGTLKLDEARHPLLLHMRRHNESEPKIAQEPSSVVPISVTLGDSFDVLVITGPNTGGKTVTLKTVGLLSAMSLAGLHIPARRGSKVPLLKEVLADIGDEQSLEQSLSTFSAHMSRIAWILQRTGPQTLVLLDELGAGTDPTEGAALGRAILDELTRLQCFAMVTTHLGDLKTYAWSTTRAENAAVEFDANTLRPTYRLQVGQFGQSCALKIARRLELPRSVLQRARKYVRRRRTGKAAELAQLQVLREEARKAKDEAEAAAARATDAEVEFRKKAETLQQEAAISAELDRFRASLRQGDLVRVSRFGKQGTIQRVDSKRKIAAVTVGAVEWQLPLEEILPMAKSQN